MKQIDIQQLRELTGRKFNRLTILSIEDEVCGKTRFAICQCECGNEKRIRLGHVKTGHTKSCGCIRPQHGYYNHPLYSVWEGMLKRCSDKNKKDYHGKGVKVCKEWVSSAKAFIEWALSNGWKRGLQLDKDIKGDGLLYSPDTCCFVTRSVNGRHKSNNNMIEFNGETKCLQEWSEIVGINPATIYSRLKSGWSPEKALSTPLMRTSKAKLTR